MKRPILMIAVGLAMARPADSADSADLPARPRIETSLATDGGQIRQFAFDGDASTFFASAEKPKSSDHFTLVLDHAYPLGSIAVTTGKPDETDRLDGGSLEVSGDGQAFEEVAKFSAGSARAEAVGRPVRAIRIKPAADLDHPLVIREIAIGSAEAVPVFPYPVEFTVDVGEAPEMKEWAEKAASLCERWYPEICEALRSEGARPATRVTMLITPGYKGVAMAGRGRITGSSRYFHDHPDDLGAMIHETVHIVQNYRGRGNPGWLVEGVADYYRFFVYEPGKAGRVNPARAHYDQSYRTTAAFLAYLAEKYDKDIPYKLHRMMREGKYKEAAFQDLTGKTTPELDEEWLASLRK